MKHRVAVGTNGAEVIDRINFVAFADAGEFLQMMNVNEVAADVAVGSGKVETTNGAQIAVPVDASLAGTWIAFVSGLQDLANRASRYLEVVSCPFGFVDSEPVSSTG
jgi:hypothetical protein